MFKILTLIFLPLMLYAYEYPNFTTQELLQIEQQVNTIAKNRASDYQEQVKVFQNYTKEKQLNITNNYLNQLLPQYDEVMQKQTDYWATPKEFLTNGYGDCEDYAIIKYFTLIKLGFNKERLFLTVVHELHKGGHHMVLSYFKKTGKSPLILDNLSFRILSLKTRTDLKADIFINALGVYELGTNNELKKVAHSYPMFLNLMKKVKNNR